MAVEYIVEAVSLTPQQTAAATRSVVSRITPKERIGWSKELNSDGFLSVSTDPFSLPDSIKPSLRDPFNNALELRLTRVKDGVATIQFQGPLLGYQIQGPTLTLHARGFLYYLRWMFIWPNDQLFESGTDDQFTIGKTLVDQWQAQDYGNFGIDTSGISTSGVQLVRRYFAVELPNVYNELKALGERDDGFDFAIDPTTLALQFFYPERGTDKSATVIIDSRNLQTPNLFVGASQQQAAALALGVGTAFERKPLTSTQENATALANFGRRAQGALFDGTETQQQLDEFTAALLDAHDQMYFAPLTEGGSVFPIPGVDVDDIDPGDTIQLNVDMGLGIQSTARKVEIVNVSVGPQGDEAMTVELLQ